MLTSCASLTNSNPKVTVVTNNPKVEIDQSLKSDCKPPVTLPDKSLTSSETALLWGEDRKNHTECFYKHQNTVKAIDSINQIQNFDTGKYKPTKEVKK